MRKEYLMAPGPTPVPPSVLAAEGSPMIHHRAPVYSEIFARVLEDLKMVFQTENDVLVFAASGTGAMESAVVNCFSPGDRVIVAQNGKFGERFTELGKVYGLDVVELAYEWGKVVDPADIKASLDEHGDSVKGVFVTHSETSTGVLNDIRSVGEMMKGHPGILIVDSITGLGAVECKTDEWGLDVVMAGSQKGLMMAPGLACVAVSEKAWAATERATLPKFYFDWTGARKAIQGKEPQTPFTPAVSLVVALAEALRLMREEGMDAVIARHQLLADATRAGVTALGLELFAPPEGRGNAVTPVVAPEGLDGEKIVKHLRTEFGITIVGGQDHLKSKVFRLGHLGYYDRFDIITMLSGLELTLKELGHPVELGSGVRAAEEVFVSAFSRVNVPAGAAS